MAERDPREARAHVAFDLLVAVFALALTAFSIVRFSTEHLFDTGVFAVVWALVSLMSVRLARGERILVDSSIALAAAFLLSAPAVAAGVALGTTFAAVVRLGAVGAMRESLNLVFRRVLLALLLVLAVSVAGDWIGALDGAAYTLAVFGFGIAHAVADLTLLAARTSLGRRQALRSAAAGLFDSLSMLLAAHVSLGTAAVLLTERIGLWSLAILLPLVMLTQYSFDLLLKTKSAYRETIEALVRASELQLPEAERGHSQRVADHAVAIGRRMAVPPRMLEHLNYAALLHEIGLIAAGQQQDDSALVDDGAAARGADIVASIPFLAPAEAMVRYQARPESTPADLDPNQHSCVRIIQACCVADILAHAEVLGLERAPLSERLDHILDSVGDGGRLRQAVCAVLRVQGCLPGDTHAAP